jgi:hypothetical protein
VGLRIPLLGVNKMGKLRRIPDEKYWSVVKHPVKVSFFGFNLDGETLHAEF